MRGTSSVPMRRRRGRRCAILEDYREIESQVWKRFTRGREDQLWYLDELLKVFKQSKLGRIVHEYERVIDDLRSISADQAK